MAQGGFDDLVRSYFEQQWDEFPEDASALGLQGYEHRLGEYSAEAFARRADQDDGWITRFESAVDGLTPDQEIDRDLILSHLRGDRVMREWAGWKRHPDTYLSPGVYSVFDMFLQRAQPDADLARAVASRLSQVPAILQHGKEQLDPELASPVFVERSIGVCTAAAAYARDLVPAEIADEAGRELVAEAGETAARAYEDFHDFLTTLRDAATGPYAIGEGLYTALLREKEMLGYGAGEMRERGRAEYDRIATEMSKLARELRGSDDFVAVVEELNRDHPATPEEMREQYEHWALRARDFFVDRGLGSLPAGEECFVDPSPPFQRPVMAVASYHPPPLLTPSLSGHFFVPFPPEGISDDELQKRLESNSHVAIPTTAVHEAYPGHHWHLITLKQNPSIARKCLWSSYFGEGWALYTEALMLEEGFYEDPRHELGVYDARIFRAARIVVDTSLHIGDMSFEEAVTFMREKTGIAEPTARAEVGRYCSWPTQASSYLTGALEIERMREVDLKDHSLKEFHDRIAGSGVLPIALAERALLAST